MASICNTDDIYKRVLEGNYKKARKVVMNRPGANIISLNDVVRNKGKTIKKSYLPGKYCCRIFILARMPYNYILACIKVSTCIITIS